MARIIQCPICGTRQDLDEISVSIETTEVAGRDATTKRVVNASIVPQYWLGTLLYSCQVCGQSVEGETGGPPEPIGVTGAPDAFFHERLDTDETNYSRSHQLLYPYSGRGFVGEFSVQD